MTERSGRIWPVNTEDVLDSTNLPNMPAVEELNTWVQEFYTFTAHTAVALGFPVALDPNGQVLLYAASRFTDISFQDNVYRCGIRIGLLITVQVGSDTKEEVLSVPRIVARAELGMVRATGILLISGYAGEIHELPAWPTFDVEAYAYWARLAVSLQEQVMVDTAKIKPMLLATTALSHMEEFRSTAGPAATTEAAAGEEVQVAALDALRPGRLDEVAGPEPRRKLLIGYRIGPR